MAATESLLFDADRVQEEQEEELKQEEDERQKELKDLLANAFDDIEADETCSFASDDSHDSGRHSDEICQQNRWTSGKMGYHASTPLSETRAPPLITPVIHRKYNSSPPTANHQPYPTRHGSDTLYQEPDNTVGLYDNNITQQSDSDSTSVPHHPYQHQQGLDRFNGSYLSSHTSQTGSDINLRHSSSNAQHSPLYRDGSGLQSNNGSTERHLTGSSDIDNTVFVECGERKTPTEQLQDRYFQEGAGGKSAQLGILYQSKSRQLQELQEKYELLQLESAKEIRILRHEVALLQGSKQGCEGSLKHTQSLLSQNKEARFELQKKLDSMEDEKNNLSRDCAELKEQLAAAEVSIEELNAQLFALGSSDTIERMREQHESIINTLRKENENNKHEHNQQVADLRQRLHAQREEMDSTTLLLKADMESIAKERVDHADTVNRLTLSLKESQRQIQDLLNESCGTELSKVKIQLQQCTAARDFSEQLCSSLQKEVSDLKEQISLYDSALATNNLFTNTIAQDTDSYDDTLVELGVKPLRKSSSCKSLGHRKEHSSEETILILRQELQKCLAVVKEKRAELSCLRTEAGQKKQEEQMAQTELALLRNRLDKCQVQLKEANIELNLYKSAAVGGKSLTEVKLNGQMESLINDKAILQEEVKCLSERLELVAGNEAKLGEINAGLNCKIAEMIDDFDRDKKAALERCQETLESHNQTVKDMMRAELAREYEMKVTRMQSQYQSELSHKTHSNEAANAELRQVKELYVQLCSEKNKLEEEKLKLDHYLAELQQRVADSEQLKADAEQVELLQQKLAELGRINSKLEEEKITLNESIDKLNVQLRMCREQKSLDTCADGDNSKMSSALSACRELFTSGRTESKCKSNNQSLDTGNFSLTNSSRHELKCLEDQLRGEKTQRADLQDEVLRARSDTETSKCELTEVQRQLSELEEKVTLSTQEIGELEEEIRQLKVIISDLRGDNQKLDKLLSAERVQLSLARDDVITLQAQVSEYKQQLGSGGSHTDRLHKVMVAFEDSKKSMSNVQTDLEAEMVAHSRSREELEKLRNCVNTESESHEQVKKRLSTAMSDLQKERRAHLQTKSELDKKGTALQAEITSHNRARIDVNKLRAEIAEKEIVSKDLVMKSELVQAQADLETERKAHLKMKETSEQLESGVSLEKTLHSQTKADLEKMSASLKNEKAKHAATMDKVASLTEELSKVKAKLNELNKVQLEFQSEQQAFQMLKQEVKLLDRSSTSVKAQLSLAQAELEKTSAALEAEVSAHRQTKSEICRLQVNLTKQQTDRENMVKRSELASVHLEFEKEKKAHLQARQSLGELENSTLSEKSFQSLTRTTLANVQQQLQVERDEHQQMREELSKLEDSLQAEQSSHNNTKIQRVTVETELTTERGNQGELRKSLEKVKANYNEQEAEMELLRANQNKDSEMIAQMKNQRQQEKSQLEGLKASHTQLVSDLNEAKAELIRKGSEVSQHKTANSRLVSELDTLAKRHGEEKQKLIDQHSESLRRAVQDAEQRWKEQSSTPAPDVLAENKHLKEKLNSLEADVVNYEKLLSQADEHFEQQLKKIRKQMQEEYAVQIEKLKSISSDNKNTQKLERSQQKAMKERLDKEVTDLKQEVTSLQQKGEELENKCKEYQSCAEDLRRNLKSLSAQTDSLKSTNKKLQAELSKTSGSYEGKVEQLSRQLQQKERELRDEEHEHGLTVQSLKQKMVALRNEQALQQTSKAESTSCACQTVPMDTGKHIYDIAIQSIRVEVLNYVEETNRNAAKLIRCEIHKAKQATARQLRNYYVKCFKQSLQDNRSSHEEKLNKLERTLDNAVAAVTTPVINTDSLLSVPEQLFTDSFRCRPHSEMCPDHTMAELYSRGPTPVVYDRHDRVLRNTLTPARDDRLDRDTPVVTDTESRYSYVSLWHKAHSSASMHRDSATPVNTTNYNTDTSDIIHELGLDNTETSPPRWYNPPPERLAPSPNRQSSATDSRAQSKFHPLLTMSSKR